MEETVRAHTGGCLCGAVRYRIADEPLHSGICHCRTCRKIASAPSLPFVVFPVRTLVFESGEPKQFASSPDVIRTFCDTCGSPLTYQNKAEPDFIDVMTVSLDKPEAYRPTFHVWASEKISWDVIGDQLQVHSKSRT
jgi:hypothetical protein